MKLSVLTPIGLKPIHAASGLVKVENNLYVVADDELSLLTFSLSDKLAGEEHKLFAGELPADHKERKKKKPDLESLTLLPKSFGASALLAVPSGSKSNRLNGSLIELINNKPSQVTEIDFSLLYKKLESEFSELNIEGACFTESNFILLQRGNGSLSQNALIELDAEGVLSDIRNQAQINENRITKITKIDLGKINGVNLGFTDACYVDEKLFFLAVAEESNSTYDDGNFSAAFIGHFDKGGKHTILNQLAIEFKPEGLWIEKSNSGYQAFVVTDADDPNQTSQLYSLKFN